MIKLKVDEGLCEEKKDKLRVRIRMDFRGEEEIGRFFFGGKSNDFMAKKHRQEQIELLKNIPLQGIFLEKIDDGADVYIVQEQDAKGRRQEIAYAPAFITLIADRIEDIIPLLLNSSFRKIEILSPEKIYLKKTELENLLYAFHKQKTLVV